ncbi:MAG: DUF2318 domain-containing protein [Desulfomicrobium sp.]|nr:DUF2318 domain-containing protein [Desulfomicrobium sp.]
MKLLQTLLMTTLLLAVAGPAPAFFGFFSEYKEVKAENGQVVIPVDRVSDGKAHHFRFKDAGVELTFFVLKSSDGAIRVAFDACDVCYHAKKGYSQDKDFMICNNCGMKFHSLRIGDVEGGCNPAPLKRAVEGDAIVIATSDLAAGKRFFQ